MKKKQPKKQEKKRRRKKSYLSHLDFWGRRIVGLELGTARAWCIDARLAPELAVLKRQRSN